MKCNRAITIGATAFLLGLTACTPNDVNLGASARHNYAMQVINPEPVYEDGAMAMDGTKAAAAVERYRTDKVKAPVSIKTTSGSGGGSGSGSGPQ